MKIQHRHILILGIFSLLILMGVGHLLVNAGDSQEIHDILIQREQEKWDLFAQGQLEAMNAYYAEDFINVASSPMGAVRQNREESFAALASLPPMPGEIVLSDFLVVQATDNSVVVSYQVSAPFGNSYASSVWVERDGKWLTVFYQDTPIQAPVQEPPSIAIPFFGHYLTQKGTGADALLLNPDGTYAVDADATNVYGTSGRFEFHGDIITFTDDERNDVPECKGEQRSANYHYSFTGGTLLLTSIDDTCQGRLAYFANRSWEK